MKSRSAFTLLEICIAVAIILLMIAMAVPGVASLFAEKRLKERFEEFDAFVHQARKLSLGEGRSFVMVWSQTGLGIEPEEPLDADRTAAWPRLQLLEGEKIAIQRPAALEEKPASEWAFWRSGTCEPAIVTFEGPSGRWVAKYDALTAHGTIIEQVVP